MSKPTEEYAAYQKAYDYFNTHLFAGRLPPCLITFQRQRRTRGYFWKHGFAARTNYTLRTDEIALNPDTFAGRTDKEILSTLVHEMCHLWQAHEGKPSRGRYHNRQWAREMLWLGLRPISLDNPGKMTGQSVTHAIVPGGRFDESSDQLLATGFRLRWQSAVALAPDRNDAVTVKVIEQKRNKTKYTCPECEQNAWAKPAARLICGFCGEPMERRARG
jgi:predicted SprT family Zn-dependent metalloprotease